MQHMQSLLTPTHATAGARGIQLQGLARSFASPAGGGNGLTGLAERTEGVHGTFEAGARPEGGLRLRLTVPLAHS
jgi:signal transduction histidine kinase